MPPRPRPIFRGSASSQAKDVSSSTPSGTTTGNTTTQTSRPTTTSTATAANSSTTSMPPPPDPPRQQGILVPELTALSACLTNAVVKTSQIYGFYADIHRLGIGKHAPHPPRSLTAALGREVEKYDQLCDAIQSHLRRAIAVLQRDLDREREHLKAAAAPPEPEHVQETAQPAASSSGTTPTTQSEASGHKPHPRRQSTISLSSLHRAPFPHKLDLSAIPLHFNPDELPLHSGLPSPVSLAPKSSRASMPPDLLGGSVDIDLTLPDDTDMSATAMMGLDPTLGNSADKPIELDLDMDIDLFPDSTGPPAAAPLSSSPPKLKQEDEGIELDLFRDLDKTADGPSPSVKPENDILSALGSSSNPSSGAPSHSQASQPYDLNMNLFNDSSMVDLFNLDNVGPAPKSEG